MAQAKIRFLGHATVFITTENGKRIVIDPWLDGNPACPKEFSVIREADAICLTHGHGDHASSALSLARETKATVFAMYDLLQLLIRDGLPEAQTQPMNKGGTIALPNGGGVAVSLTQALHSSSYLAKDGTLHYAGEPCGIVLHLESGRTIYHAGDTALFGDMKLIEEEFEPVVALLPIGDRFTMGPVAAAKAITIIKPKYAIPLHYNTFPALPGTLEEFVRHAAQTNAEVIALRPGQEFAF